MFIAMYLQPRPASDGAVGPLPHSLKQYSGIAGLIRGAL